MAITVDWPTGVITVQKADMILIQSIPIEIYQLDLDFFRLTLKGLEDDYEGMPWPTTHNHNTTVAVGGAVLARVVELINGYTVTFEDGQYAVNLVGANSNVGDNINVNQVSVRSSNSAGLQDLNSLQAASFGGAVAIDVNSIYSGVVFPVGVRSTPVNNLPDALEIAGARGLHKIQILSDMTFTSADASAGFRFVGDSPVKVSITLDAGADVENCEFEQLSVQGTLDGSNTFERCNIMDINFFNGAIYESSLSGTITLGGAEQAEIYDSWSGVPGGGAGATPEIMMGASGQDLLMRNYSGGIEITGCTGASNASIDLASGRVVLSNTNTAGSFWIRGVADVFDGTNGSTVYDQTVNVRVDQLETLMRAGRRTRNGLVEFLDDAGAVIYTAAAWEDTEELTLHTGGAIRKHEFMQEP